MSLSNVEYLLTQGILLRLSFLSETRELGETLCFLLQGLHGKYFGKLCRGVCLLSSVSVCILPTEIQDEHFIATRTTTTKWTEAIGRHIYGAIYESSRVLFAHIVEFWK